ncbi:MAG TPA: hypothetical protein VMR21_04145 [Vicinamibacteria bacterium]|nr:hypothetical protein [Vicinamibacteria bacterium]
MGAAWPEIDELIRDLGDVCALADTEGEPSLSAATLAVTKATTALTHAAQVRGRGAAAALAQARAAVEEARASLQSAREAIAASVDRRRVARSRATAPPPEEAALEGRAEATCTACGRPFVVRYRAVAAHPVVAFPVACPAPSCDGLAEIEFPASAVEVNVEAAD